jgi:hypothetical protein
MKKIYLLLAAVFFIILNLACYSQEKSVDPNEFILDYNVPESPGFTVLGVNPNKVVTGTNAKPLVLNVLGQFAFNDKLTPGFAMDFTPIIFGITFKNRDEYRSNYFKRLMANTSVSLATVKDKIDTNSTKFGLGFRFTLFDQTDVLMNEDVCELIQDAMVEFPSFDSGNDGISVHQIPALKKAYLEARKKLLSKTRHSLSIGYGLEGLIKNSVLNKDSILTKSHSLWVGGQSTFKDFKLLYTYQSKFGSKFSPENLLGVAIRTNRFDLNASMEVLYNFKAQKFDGALTGEMKIVNNLSAIVGISLVNENVLNVYQTKLNLVSNIRYNIGN